MARNFQAVDHGVADGLTMKYPAGSLYESAVQTAHAVAEVLDKTVKVVRV